MMNELTVGISDPGSLFRYRTRYRVGNSHAVSHRWRKAKDRVDLRVLSSSYQFKKIANNNLSAKMLSVKN